MYNPEKNCQKCGEKIGGKAYYIVRLDCIYDGKEVSACKSLVVCSKCYNMLKLWLKIQDE
jgi:hypothetical protein